MVAAKVYKCFPPHLKNVSTPPCEFKLEMLTCYHWVVREKNSRNYPTSTVATNSLVDYIAREILQEKV